MRREPKSRASTIFAIPAYSVLTQGRAVFDDAQLVNSIEYATTGAQVGQRHLAAKVTPPRFYRKNVRGALAGEEARRVDEVHKARNRLNGALWTNTI